MNCFRMCAAVWCVSTGTAAQPCISPRTIIEFQFLNLRMTGLKTNGTYYNRPIIHIGEWKHPKYCQFKTPLKVLSISNKTTCALLWCIFFIYFLCLNSLLCVFVFSWENIIWCSSQEHHFLLQLFKTGIKTQTLTFFFCTWACSFSDALDGFRRNMLIQ